MLCIYRAPEKVGKAAQVIAVSPDPLPSSEGLASETSLPRFLSHVNVNRVRGRTGNEAMAVATWSFKIPAKRAL